MDGVKKLVISCGPIPAKLDSVKYITNRFKGGLAFKAAKFFALRRDLDVTVVKWRHTEFPYDPESAWRDYVTVVEVDDVVEYCEFFRQAATEHRYDAYVMSAAVANLMPSEPYSGKFPSHLYKPGDRFDIKFEIAPRAIDQIKRLQPRACLIGYKLFDAGSDEELVGIARTVLDESKADIVFANTPASAKIRKIAVTSAGEPIETDFQGHLEMILKAVMTEHYRTETDAVDTHTDDSKFAEAIVRMFEKTFPGHGSVAVPVPLSGPVQGFWTTSRGHAGDPVYVSHVDHVTGVVHATGKATMNAPELDYAVRKNPGCIVIHRHADDPRYECSVGIQAEIPEWDFPGTKQAVSALAGILPANCSKPFRAELARHGDIKIMPILPVDWVNYKILYPQKYMLTARPVQALMDRYNEGPNTLEIGCNSDCACAAGWDKYAPPGNGKSIQWRDIEAGMIRDFVLCRNAIAYLSDQEIRTILSRSEVFVANAFACPPVRKISDDECAVATSDKRILHALRLADDYIMVHWFHNRTMSDWAYLGLGATSYNDGRSLLLTKGITMEEAAMAAMGRL